MMTHNKLPVPSHFNPDKVDKVWRVPYQERAQDAEKWAEQYDIQPSASDKVRICLMAVDVQNSFCIPEFDLYVGGRSGRGAVDDNRRLCEFIYSNLDVITQVCPTMDTHQAMQIFHSVFLVNENGEHPEPFTIVSVEDIEQGIWRFNSKLHSPLGISVDYGQKYLLHYTKKLKEGGKYDLTIWPYHGMLGGIGHTLVSSFEETIFFHSIARYSQTDFQVKGNNPFTENYSVLSPDVLEDPAGKAIAKKNTGLIKKLMEFDALIIAGQAKSHCVAWTIDNLLEEIYSSDKGLAVKVYIIEDCMSPVVIPGVIDYTDHANEAFERFADAGIHIVRSTEPIESWPGIKIDD